MALLSRLRDPFLLPLGYGRVIITLLRVGSLCRLRSGCRSHGSCCAGISASTVRLKPGAVHLWFPDAVAGRFFARRFLHLAQGRLTLAVADNRFLLRRTEPRYRVSGMERLLKLAGGVGHTFPIRRVMPGAVGIRQRR